MSREKSIRDELADLRALADALPPEQAAVARSGADALESLFGTFIGLVQDLLPAPALARAVEQLKGTTP